MPLAVALLLSMQIAAGALAPDCSVTAQRALDAAGSTVQRGDLAAAYETLTAVEAKEYCRRVTLARLAVAGWDQARALAAQGGPVDLLGPVRATLAEIRELSQTILFDLERDYAHTVIRAAVAAAQDERPEMELLLTHARDLVERIQLRGGRAVWPRPFNEAAGELWFEVDRYEDARAAYERALRADSSAVALVGLARAQARLGNEDAACATYARARDAAPSLRESAAGDLGHCR